MKRKLALLGLPAVLLVTIACGTSTPNLEAARAAQDKATMEALATAIAEQQGTQQPPSAAITTLPTPTSVVGIVTATPQDTLTLVPPTSSPVPADTPVPTPTEPSDTPPGSILEVGASWYQNGVRLKLEETQLSPNCLSILIDFYNETAHQLVLVIDLEEISAEDNLGQRWPPVSLSDWIICDTRGIYTDKQSETVDPGDNYGAHWIGFEGPVTDSRVTEVVVTVQRMSQISNAKWRIPIYH